MTFSIVGRCARTGSFGVAITSSSPAVASRCSYVRAGVGAVATQNVTDPSLGPATLDALARGLTAVDAVAEVSASASYADFRQVTAVDRAGRTAVFSGARSLGVNGDASGSNCQVAGNLLASLGVLTACAEAFGMDPSLPLEARLLSALEAGQAVGGEAGPVHSAGLLVADQVVWPTTDLRIDWSDDPIGDLRSLWLLWAPQKDAYLARALDPTSAPSYGVPGDDR